MKYGFIYVITNCVNGKKYIGMRKYSKGRELYMGSSKPLKRDIEKYGASNFNREIIEECESAASLQEREIYHLTKYNIPNNADFYNQCVPHKEFRIKGNTSANKGRTWEEIYGIEGARKRRLNSKLKGRTWVDIYGENESNKKREINKKKRTLETRTKMSNSRKGIKYSEITIERIRQGIIKHYKEKRIHESSRNTL